MRALILLPMPALAPEISDIPKSVHSRGLAMGRSVFLLLVATLFLPISVAMADSAKLTFNGHSYQRFDTIMSWTAAKAFCESKGAHLATITSQAEDDFVGTNLVTKFVWLGGADAASEGNWTWITGETWSYTHWNQGEPNNSQPGEHYLQYTVNINSIAAAWNDAYENGGAGSSSPVCEWEDSSLLPTSGLVGYWNFNTCSAVDGSGSANSGTLVGSPTCEAGASGVGLRLNSTNYAEMPDNASLDLATQLTISLWFKADGLTNDYPLRLVDKITAGGADGYYFPVWSGGIALSNGQADVQAHVPVSSRVFHHVAATYADGTGRIYLNGQLVGSGAMGPFPVNSLPLRIGSSQGTLATPLENFSGVIDEVRLYNRALSDGEVGALALATPSAASGSFLVNAASSAGTGFTVPQGVSTCAFTATGSWNFYSGDPANQTGPDGFIPPIYGSGYMSTTVPAGALFMRSNAGDTFIGSGAVVNMVAGEVVRFFPNDGLPAFWDNSGSMAVNYVCSAPAISTHPLTVAGSGTGTGTITSTETSAHITCTSMAGTTSGTCSSDETVGATVTLTATPAAGSTFTGWSGACTNATGTCTVTMDAATMVAAGFELQGDVTAPTLSSVGVSGSTQTETTLVATSNEAAIGYWLVVPSGAAAPTASQIKAGANYDAVTVAAHGSRPMSANLAADFPVIGLMAATDYDLYFVAEDVSANTNLSGVVGPVQFVTSPATYALSVGRTGLGLGTVTSDIGGISCTIGITQLTGTCSANIPADTQVLLTVIPEQGGADSIPSGFSGWAGCDGRMTSGSGSLPQCAVAMNTARTVSPLLTLQVDSDGDGVWDEWESQGIPLEDGTQLTLPDANPNRKDVWIWIDQQTNLPSNVRFQAQAGELVRKAFARNGIVAHLNDQTVKPRLDWEQPVLWPESRGVIDSIARMKRDSGFYSVNGKLETARDQAWRYVVWGSKYINLQKSIEPRNSTGLGSPRLVFIAAQAGCDLSTNDCSPVGKGLKKTIEQAGTLLHELGHTFGLGHGGPWGLDPNGPFDEPYHVENPNSLTSEYNYKPNHLSVMNYAYQTTGLDTRLDEEYKIDFEAKQRPVIDERNLIEFWNTPVSTSAGQDPDYGVVFLCDILPGINYQESVVSGSQIGDLWANGEYVSFGPGRSANCGNTVGEPTKADLDGNGSFNQIVVVPEWSNLDFRYGGLIGAMGTDLAASQTPSAQNGHVDTEPSLQELRRPLTYDHSVVGYGDMAKPGVVGTSVQFAFNVENQGFVADSYDLTVVSERGWVVSNLVTQVTAAPGERVWGSFSVVIPLGEEVGTLDRLTVTARSLGKPNNSDSKEFFVLVDAAQAGEPTPLPNEITTAQPFSFAAVTGVTPGSRADSTRVTLSGFNVPIGIRVRGGLLSINGGAWSAAEGQVNAGDSIQLRVVAPTAGEATQTAEVAVGGQVATFSVTSGAMYSVTMSSEPAVGGSVTCLPEAVPAGGEVTCDASAMSGHIFIGWSGDCTGQTCVLANVQGPRSVTAHFVADTSALTVWTGVTSSGGTGSIAVTGSGCSLASAAFVAAPAEGMPPGTSFPHGLADFSIVGCSDGMATVTVTYPTPIPAGAKFWKAEGGAYSEYVATIGAYSVIFILGDNGAGDRDPTSGVIHDPSGIGVAAVSGDATPIPTLSEGALILLAGLLSLAGWLMVRRGGLAVRTSV